MFFDAGRTISGVVAIVLNYVFLEIGSSGTIPTFIWNV